MVEKKINTPPTVHESRIRPSLQRENHSAINTKTKKRRISWGQKTNLFLLSAWQNLAQKFNYLLQRIFFRQIWVLNINEDGLYVWRGRIGGATFYPANDTGVALFQTWLVSLTHRECRILVDSVAEHFVTERIARLGWLDRKAILERHRQRQFPNKRFSTVMSLGISPQFHQEAILFTAIDDHGEVTRWLDALEVNRAPLSGIWTPSLFLPNLLLPLGKLPARCLLLTQHGSYLRESFLMYDKVRFSRLVKIAPYALSSRCAEEIPILLQYLITQRWVQAGQLINIYIITHPSQTKLFAAANNRLTGVRIELVDIHQLARFFHLPQLPLDDDVSPLIRHLLVHKPSISQYASRALRYNFYSHRWSIYLRSMMIALCLIGLGVTYWQMSKIKEYEGQFNLLSNISTNNPNKSDAGNETMEELPQLPVSIEWMKQTTNRKNSLESRQEKGRELWNHVLRATKNTSGVVVIDRLVWKNDLIEGDLLELDGHISLLPSSSKREAEAAFELFRQMISSEYVISVLRSPLQSQKQDEGKIIDDNEALFSISIHSSRI